MMRRKVNGLLVLFSLAGGFLGYLIGEVLLERYGDSLSAVLVTGLYFGILALTVGLFCLLAELLSPRLNGISWKRKYSGTSWAMLVPCTFVLLLLGGMLFEFLYGLNLRESRGTDNMIMAIDVSGSMKETDPEGERFAAAKDLIRRLDRGQQLAVIAFNHKAEVIQPLRKLGSSGAEKEALERIDGIQTTDGGTEISLALSEAMKLIREDGGRRKTMVILLSDGYSAVDLSSALSEYVDKGVTVNTVGMSLVEPDGRQLLQNIASRTGGSYYDVTNAEDVKLAFDRIYVEQENRTLLTDRTDAGSHDKLYAAMRILFYAVLGGLMGLALGLLFDNRFLARSFSMGGITGGMAAGLLMEAGFGPMEFDGSTNRLLAALALSAVIALFTGVIAVRDPESIASGKGRGNTLFTGRSFGEAEQDRTNQSF